MFRSCVQSTSVCVCGGGGGGGLGGGRLGGYRWRRRGGINHPIIY